MVSQLSTTPSSSSSPTRSSVPSHGIRGWSQAIQASRRPSGLIRGKARKSLSATTSRTSPDPSSGTATTARVTGARPVSVSRTHHTSVPSCESTGSAYRQPDGVGGSGVSGCGSLPASSRYRRWSLHSLKTSAWPASVGTASQHAPPYSCTRVRAFHGAGSTSPPARVTT